MKDFCEMYDLENLISGPTCFKNANNPSSIDVMVTNRKTSFQNSMTIETGLSDHHKIGCVSHTFIILDLLTRKCKLFGCGCQ